MQNVILARIELFLESNNIYRDMISGFHRGHCATDDVIDLVTAAQQHKDLCWLCGEGFLVINGALDYANMAPSRLHLPQAV